MASAGDANPKFVVLNKDDEGKTWWQWVAKRKGSEKHESIGMDEAFAAQKQDKTWENNHGQMRVFLSWCVMLKHFKPWTCVHEGTPDEKRYGADPEKCSCGKKGFKGVVEHGQLGAWGVPSESWGSGPFPGQDVEWTTPCESQVLCATTAT